MRAVRLQVGSEVGRLRLLQVTVPTRQPLIAFKRAVFHHLGVARRCFLGYLSAGHEFCR
jgi:hypothetical protein